MLSCRNFDNLSCEIRVRRTERELRLCVYAIVCEQKMLKLFSEVSPCAI